MFDWRPDHSPDWEVSFYQSLKDADGVLLLGGGESTLIAGMVAMGYRIAVVALAGFSGKAARVWEALRPGRDLPSHDEISMMARPGWSADHAQECVEALRSQLARRQEEERQRRLEELRRETSITWHAIWAGVVFLAAVLSVPLAWGDMLNPTWTMWLLFVSPLLAGVAGSTIRLVFDLRQGAVPLTRQSAITTAALGMIAGGAAGLLFVTAQVAAMSETFSSVHARKLIPFGVMVGFISGLTLDAVFRKLIASDVVDVSSVEAKKRT